MRKPHAGETTGNLSLTKKVKTGINIFHIV